MFFKWRKKYDKLLTEHVQLQAKHLQLAKDHNLTLKESIDMAKGYVEVLEAMKGDGDVPTNDDTRH